MIETKWLKWPLFFDKRASMQAVGLYRKWQKRRGHVAQNHQNFQTLRGNLRNHENENLCNLENTNSKREQHQQYKGCIVATTKENLYEALQEKQREYISFLQNEYKNKNQAQNYIINMGMQHKPIKQEDSDMPAITISTGLVPTMGALHNGHKSLINANVEQNHIAVVSIFVNPTQFAKTEDLSTYPRTLEKDIEMCEEAGVDIVFAPKVEVMYEDGDEVSIEPPQKMGYILEGYYRPTHFRGVLQVVLKLFNLISPTRAYFGQKDAQQLMIIKKMVKQLYLPIEIISMPIVRDSDNLALSSRNVYLSASERKLALAIPKAIFHIQNLTNQNKRDISMLKQEALGILDGLHIDYMDFYNHDLTFATKAQNCIFLLVVRIGNIRLLDNLYIE